MNRTNMHFKAVEPRRCVVAALLLALVRPLAGVRADVRFERAERCSCIVAALLLALVGLLARVLLCGSHVVPVSLSTLRAPC